MTTVTQHTPVSSIAAQYGVTQEQIDRTDRVIDYHLHKVFYLVESESEPGTYYRVEWNEQFGCLQCRPHHGRSCPASQQGIPCWHKRAALAAEKLYKAERQRERQREQAEVDEIVAEADRREQERKDAEYNRYLNYCIQLDI
jgi:hypothetical protein